MPKYDIPPQFKCQNRILNVKIQYSANFEFQNRILNVKIRFSAPQFECQNRILNVKILYFASVPISKYNTRPNFECQKTKSEKRKTNKEKRKMKNERQTNFTLLSNIDWPIWLDTDYALPKSDTCLKALLVLYAQNEYIF